MSSLPSGTITFLFTDIEGSTALWERHRDVMQAALTQHHAILRASIESNAGHVFNIVGDAFCAAFATAPAALAAAVAAQRSPTLRCCRLPSPRCWTFALSRAGRSSRHS